MKMEQSICLLPFIARTFGLLLGLLMLSESILSALKVVIYSYPNTDDGGVFSLVHSLKKEKVTPSFKHVHSVKTYIYIEKVHLMMKLRVLLFHPRINHCCCPLITTTP